MEQNVRQHLIDSYGGDSIYVTKLSTGYRYRIVCGSDVIHSGVLSNQKYMTIYMKLEDKRIEDLEEELDEELSEKQEDPVIEELEPDEFPEEQDKITNNNINLEV